MRTPLIALALLYATSAAAQQAEDEERPNTRSTKRGASDESTDSDTPDPDANDGPAESKRVRGDAPLSLRGRGKGAGDVTVAHPEGAYAGVTIGGEGLPPHPPKLPMKGGQRMLWPGFQVRAGVPTVFLQTTGAPNYAVSETPGAIIVTLRATKIQLRNNQRPLKVGEFGTAVTEVSAKPRGGDVVVTIKHKGGASHREHVEPSAGGYQLLVVELPGK